MENNKIDLNDRVARVDKKIFWPAITTITMVLAAMIFFEEGSLEVVKSIFGFITNQLGFLYIWAGAIILGAVAWLSFGKYSHIRLGGTAAKPEFSRMSWIAMFFCSGIGTALIYWASIEWTYYYTAPPFGLEPKSQAALEYSAMYGMFHWGPIGWAFYCLTALPIGYTYYNRKKGGLRLSSACAGIIGEKNANGLIGKIIDVLMIFGLIGATATVLASSTPMLAQAVSRLVGIEHTFNVDIAVVCIWTLIFVTSVVLGLNKGIKVLSDINLVAVLLLCALVFIGGPTFFLLNLFTDSFGLMIKEFARMSFYTDPIGKSMFPQWWTIFYWAWWAAYGPYMGIFIARISRGRTFREIGLTVTLAGSAGCMLFFMLFGNNMINAEINGLYPVLDTIDEQGPAAAILGVLMQLPVQWLVLPLFVFVGFVYSGTTVDSSAYVMSSISSKELHEGQEPAMYNRLFWALVLGATGLVIMNFGGLEPLKTASIIVGLPLVFLMLISFMSLVRWLKADMIQENENSVAKRAQGFSSVDDAAANIKDNSSPATDAIY